ncbi:DNA-binding domain-containing protein [Acidaminobacter sp.]|uniref:DNA-binding domain-containing protein n=1 Tax=Acidaminobacter sp. TaxID=1872102 RepID=UPI00137DC734|nr:DNA-binding domain-containing protein [Acidaminobacter sp.]MDK9711603.1 DNA-binding domain-containing protein [Acidaminobacter sp.]MZQ97228.1 response regulator [Acidaminobacter sp.]
MACSFYIVDDDRSVRKILSQIISTHFNDSEIFQSDDPWFAVQDILRHNPEIVVLDLLMEGMDGIEVSEALIKNNFQGQIVMLSEVGAKEIIAQAYKSGVDHYINKPINVTEVVTVLSRTLEMHQLKHYVRLVGTPATSKNVTAAENGTCQKRSKLQNILKEVGILGESGCDELLFALPQIRSDLPLGQFYQWLKDHYPSYAEDTISLKGIEQRLRRLVQLAMENIANIGVEDFSNYKFERYSTTLFSFKAIRQEMEYARGNSPSRGKVDVKRFVEGISALIE